MAKSKGLYTQTLPVPPKKIAGGTPVGNPAPVGEFPSPTVPEHAGQLHGTGQPTKPFGHPSVKGAHGFGHVAKMKHGHLRLSGYTDAHRLGVRGKTAKTPNIS